MTDTIAQLQQQAAQAAAQAAELQTALQQRQAEETARYETARADWARRFLAGYADAEAAALAEEKEAERALQAAVLADPMIAAWVRMRAARYRLATISGDAINLANRYQLTGAPAIEHRRSGVELVEEIVRITEREAGNIGQDESNARYAEMEAAGEQARQGR